MQSTHTCLARPLACALYYIIFLPSSNFVRSSPAHTFPPSHFFPPIFQTSSTTKHCTPTLSISMENLLLGSPFDSSFPTTINLASLDGGNVSMANTVKQTSDGDGQGSRPPDRDQVPRPDVVALADDAESDASTTATSERPHCLGTGDGKFPKMFPSKVPVARSWTHAVSASPRAHYAHSHPITRLLRRCQSRQCHPVFTVRPAVGMLQGAAS